jgi:alpha-beta hydrolase superfamily lysophospholipase
MRHLNYTAHGLTGGFVSMIKEGTFNGVDGTELFHQIITPLSAPKAAVILVHGHGDHSGGMKNLSTSLVKKDYLVYAFDLRGHGKSKGNRGYIRSWNDFNGDLHEFRKLVSIEQPALPLYIVGHSIGALITLEYALEHSEGMAGIVAISPALSYEVNPIERLGISLMGKLKPDYSINLSGRFQKLAKNPAKHAKFYSDRLRHNIITPGLGRGLMEARARVEKQAYSLMLPMLLQYGLEDKITPPGKLKDFFIQVGSKNKQLLEYASARHRPFDGFGKDKFLRDLTAWLDQQTHHAQSGHNRKSV